MADGTILIIDDTPDHLDLLRRLLQAVGYQVMVARPGAEAVDQARHGVPDLIVTALSLPGQPGWETTRALRAQPALEQTPILGTTVYTTLLSSARVRSIGCEGYVEKPFNIDDLLSRIKQLLPEAPRPLIAA